MNSQPFGNGFASFPRHHACQDLRRQGRSEREVKDMGVNQTVLDIAYVSKDMSCNTDLQQILGVFANSFVSATPRVALEEWKRASCEHALIVIDGYALGREALELCRRLRLAGVSKPIILAWIHSTDLDRAVCREFGASALISRPFDLNKVASSIRAAATDSVGVDQSYGMGTEGSVGRLPSYPTASIVNARKRSKVRRSRFQSAIQPVSGRHAVTP
jgi:DNA-binding response OmpR family regulator